MNETKLITLLILWLVVLVSYFCIFKDFKSEQRISYTRFLYLIISIATILYISLTSLYCSTVKFEDEMEKLIYFGFCSLGLQKSYGMYWLLFAYPLTLFLAISIIFKSFYLQNNSKA